MTKTITNTINMTMIMKNKIRWFTGKMVNVFRKLSQFL